MLAGARSAGSILARLASVREFQEVVFPAAFPDQPHLARMRHDHFMVERRR
jgi:hypothetical protein